MSNNHISTDVQERIKADAADVARGIGDPKRLDATYYGYIAGATAEALKYAELKNQYDSARSALDTKQCELLREIGECNAITERAQELVDTLEWIKTYGPVDDRTVKFIDNALQQWKNRKDKGNAND